MDVTKDGFAGQSHIKYDEALTFSIVLSRFLFSDDRVLRLSCWRSCEGATTVVSKVCLSHPESTSPHAQGRENPSDFERLQETSVSRTQHFDLLHCARAATSFRARPVAWHDSNTLLLLPATAPIHAPSPPRFLPQPTIVPQCPNSQRRPP
jgi:hypothetical protein